MNKLSYLLKRMESRGIRTKNLLAGTGIRTGDLNSPSYKPSVTQYRAVLRKIIELSPPGIGIAMGLETTIGDEGILGYAALSSATLRDVNALIKKYLPLVDDVTLYSDEVVKGEWRIEFAPVYPMGDVLPFLMEELFARSKVEFKAYTAVDVRFKRLDLAYPEPPYGRLYREVFDCPIRFDQNRNLLAIDANYLDLPIVFSNPDVCRLCEAQCAKLLGEINNSSSVGTEIRRRLILSPGQYPCLAEMSSAMGLSVTSLKRRLREEGETYQGILDGIRKELAIQYLTETKLTPKEIGYRLGFSNVHNFRRAFKAWTGANPSHFQNSGNQ
jgi:AraC-like DNA-binding protein